MNFNGLIRLILCSLALAGCSTYRDYAPAIKPEKQAQSVEPVVPPPPPPKKKELLVECKIMNGEGRTFKARAGDRFNAERKAKQDCEINYRRCTVLKCESVLADE